MTNNKLTMSLYDYNPTAIQMRLDKLSLAELVILCYDQFPEVYQLFKAEKEMTLPQKIVLLHQYCAKTQSWAKLLTHLNIDPLLYQQVNPKKQRELIDLLFESNMMSNDDSRNAVVADLPAEIRGNIIRNPMAKVDIRYILEACLKQPDGLDELLNVIRFYEGNSLPIQRVDEFLR